MLQRIGDALKGKKILAYLILIPLVLVFAVWGAAGVVNMDFFGSGTYAATVNGTSIPVQRASELWRDQQSRFQQQIPGEIPEATRKALQDGLLEQLIRETLVSERTAALGYRVGEDRIRAAIEREAAFQVDGKYSETLALARLAQVGLTPERYRVDLRTSLQNTELQRALQVSEFLTPREAGRRLTLENEQREVRYAVWPLESFEAQVRVEDAAVAEFYEKNKAQFQTPESVRLQFAELRLAQIAAQTTVTEADLQGLYAKNRDRYSDAEKRRPRHILIAVSGGNDAAALKQAETVLAEARAGKDFAALARQYSADSGSASQGGDLGWSERTVFVGPFADAVFSMKDGELRGPVKTEFGYHIIRLDGVQAARNKTYEEARPELDAEYRRDRAADVFGDRQEQVQRRLEQPGAAFEALAKDFGLTIGEVPEFLRNGGGAPLGADPGLEEVVFGDAVLNQRKVGGPVALGEDRFVLVRVLDHRKPTPRALVEVREDIVKSLRRERAGGAARAAADAAARQLEAGGSFEAIAKASGATLEAARFVGRGDPALQAQVRELAFSLPRPKGKPLVRALSLDSGGAAVVTLLSTRAAPPDGNAQLQQQLVREAAVRAGSGDVAGYVGELRRTAKVKKNAQAFE